MSEHQLTPPFEHSVITDTHEGARLQNLARERLLKELLDPPLTPDESMDYEHCPNYEYAHDSGLLDVFAYDPDIGEDGIIHTLIGDVRVSDTGYTEVSGFHHEPSAADDPETYVNPKPLEGKNKKALRDYRHFPYEPYGAYVVIKGYEKAVLRRSKDGDMRHESATSKMFPDEYDALTVLQSIRIARDGRDRSMDMPGSQNTIVAEGRAPLLDGKNFMSIRLILDRDTEQVVTASPVTRRVSSMNLQEDDITEHLLNSYK